MKEDDMRPDEEEGSAVDKTAASRADTLPLRGRNRDSMARDSEIDGPSRNRTEIIRSGGILTI